MRTRPEGKLTRGTFLSYLTLAAALAISRVALYAWVTHRAFTHTVSDLDRYVWEWVFYPEGLILDCAPFALVYYSRTATNVVLGSLVALVSFIIALPILPLGWLMRRRRQNAGR